MTEKRAGTEGQTGQDRKARIDHGPLGIRIARDGQWFYHGSPIARKEMVCLFASMLTRREDGSYWLIAPSEEGWIEVEDVPFLAVEAFSSGQGRARILSFRTNIDEIVPLDGDHPLRMSDGAAGKTPYLLIRPGIEARLARSVYYELADLGSEEIIDGRPLYGVWSAGRFFPLGPFEGE